MERLDPSNPRTQRAATPLFYAIAGAIGWFAVLRGETYAAHRFVDVLVHGWDLAKATGQDTRLDPELVQACLDVVEPEADIWREAGVFGAKPDLPAGADVQARLLALVGRTA